MGRSYVIPYYYDHDSDELLLMMAVVREYMHGRPDGNFTLSILGGGCHSRQAPEQCAAREACEETAGALNLNPAHLVSLRSGTKNFYALPVNSIGELQDYIDGYDRSGLRPECYENNLVYVFSLSDLLSFRDINPDYVKAAAKDTELMYKEGEKYRSKPRQDAMELEQMLATDPTRVHLWYGMREIVSLFAARKDELVAAFYRLSRGGSSASRCRCRA
ncbi:MAG: NUDIX hydrolase [Sulfobacillus sp.]